MAENNRPNDGGSYSSLEWREVWRRFLSNGVIPGVEDELACTGDGATLNIAVAAGEAMVNGNWYQNTASQNQAQVPDAGDPRINRIVLRWTSAGDSVTCETLEGTPGAVPVAPTLTQDANTWEYSLCQVYVAAAAASLATSNITNEAEWAHPQGNCLVDKLTNDSGSAQTLGTVAVVDTSDDSYFNVTSTARDLTVLGVVGEYSIANAAAGDIVRAGLAWVYCDAAVTRGQYIKTGTTSGQATSGAAYNIGTFGRALQTTSGAGLCLCWLFGAPVAGTITPTAYMPIAYNSSSNVPDGTVGTDALEASCVTAAKVAALGRGAFVWSVGGTLAVATNAGIEFAAPYALTLTGGYIIAKTAPTAASLIMDVHSGAAAGTTVFTTQGNRPTLAAAATGPTAVVAPDVTSISAGTRLFCAIDQIGSTVAGADVTLVLAYTYALA